MKNQIIDGLHNEALGGAVRSPLPLLAHPELAALGHEVAAHALAPVQLLSHAVVRSIPPVETI